MREGSVNGEINLHGCDKNLIEVERRQVWATRSLLLGVAALLQSFVSGQEEAHPGAGGGRRVLTGEQEANQHPSDLVIAQGSSVSAGKIKGCDASKEETSRNNFHGW